MKWIRFIAISIVMCLYGYRMMACSDYYTPEMCNMFSVYNHNDLYTFNRMYGFNEGNKMDAAQFNFWKSYFNNKVNSKTIKDALFNNETKALSGLIKDLQQHKDIDGVHYLILLQQMRKIDNGDAWNYPTKEQLANNNRTWTNILNDASRRIVSSKKLGSRYWLMAMRAAFYTNNKEQCQWLWDKYQANCAHNDIRILAEGYLASYWYKNGEQERAREFYAKVGDLQSLRWCFRSDIGLKGIQKLYAEAPNSVAFPYLIQDYVNAIDNDLHPAWEEPTENDSVRQIVTAEMKEFRRFADRVLNENKVQNPALWKSAAAYFAYLLRENKTAINELKEADQLRGTDRMKENIRVLRLMVESDASDYNNPSFDEYVLKELRWLMAKAKNEPLFADYNYKYYVRNHYTDVLQRIVLYNLTPGYLRAGKFNTGTVLTGMTNEFVNMCIRKNKRTNKHLADWTEGYYRNDYSDCYFALLDTADVKEVVRYQDFLSHPAKGSALEQYAASYCYNDMNYYNELIGTKYMRIEDFGKATEYLKKVSLPFISAMNIAPYLHADSSYPMWYVWKYRKALDKKRFAKVILTVNPKLLFCNSMLALRQRLMLATDDKEKGNLNYELAKKYIQASNVGHCWGYLHYAWSIDSTFGARDSKEQYIAHAKECLQQSMKQNQTTINKINCLFALASLADSPWRTWTYDQQTDKNIPEYHKESSQAQLFAQLCTYRSTTAFINEGLSKCDNLKSYIDYYRRK